VEDKELFWDHKSQFTYLREQPMEAEFPIIRDISFPAQPLEGARHWERDYLYRHKSVTSEGPGT
jgi:hypothetical protein